MDQDQGRPGSPDMEGGERDEELGDNNLLPPGEPLETLQVTGRSLLPLGSPLPSYTRLGNGGDDDDDNNNRDGDDNDAMVVGSQRAFGDAPASGMEEGGGEYCGGDSSWHQGGDCFLGGLGRSSVDLHASRPVMIRQARSDDGEDPDDINLDEDETGSMDRMATSP